MATIARGSHDELVEKIKRVLDEYEQVHSGASASVYRQNSGSIRVRIIDDQFSGKSKGERHDAVWDFLVQRLPEDDVQEISVLLLLTAKETKSSFMNFEFDDPIPSAF